MSSGRVMGFASQPMYGGGFTHRRDAHSTDGLPHHHWMDFHTDATLPRLMAFLITIGWTSTPMRRSLV